MSVTAHRISIAIAVLALAVIAVSSVSLRNHYATSATTYCDVVENFTCDIVNRSAYSVVVGIPVALIGIMGYAVLLGLSTLYRAKAETPAMLLIASVAGLGFALYLTYIEGFVLGVWCILCLSSLALIFSIAVLSSLLVIHSGRRLRNFRA